MPPEEVLIGIVVDGGQIVVNIEALTAAVLVDPVYGFDLVYQQAGVVRGFEVLEVTDTENMEMGI